jgi:replication factor C subunit 1
VRSQCHAQNTMTWAPAHLLTNSYLAFKARTEAGPKAPGSKVIPEGTPGCLEGLTFVFTGELESLGRDDANELAKRYGA